MKRLPQIMLGLYLSIGTAAQGKAEWVWVQRVIDGDTFVTSDSTTIRVRGIDTPETKHPTIGEEPGGAAATQLAKFFLEGNYVWLDGNSKDKYGRRLANVTLAGGTSYVDVVRSNGYDKSSNSIYSRLGTYRYQLGTSVNKPRTTTPKLETSFTDATWVNGYFRSDGIWVSGHWRSDSTNPMSAYSEPTVPMHSSSSLPSQSGSGEIHVNGYFRKDGTYVQPYTRSSPRK